MHFEYALDPNIVAKARDLRDARFLLRNFGMAAGRIVARFPGRWNRLVFEAFDADPAMRSQDMRRKRVEELVTQLTLIHTKRPGNSWNEEEGWIENAIREHNREPFQMVLVAEKDSNQSNVHSIEEIEADPPEEWEAPHTKEVRKTAPEMASAIASMLRMAKSIWFVDPYFRAQKPEFHLPLKEFLKHTSAVRKPEIQIHVRLKDDNNPLTEEWADIKGQSRKHLPNIIPRGQSITLRCWTEREDGESLHNRYILTDVGSIVFPYGLAEGTGPGSTDTLARLDVDSHQERLRKYDVSNPAFDLAGEVVIEGTAED